MLQRPQTVFLLAVFVLSLLMLSGPLAVVTAGGHEIILRAGGVFDLSGDKLNVSTWPLAVLITGVSVLVILDILSYKNRIRQIRITIFLVLLFAGMTGMIFYYVHFIRERFQDPHTLHQWRIVVPPIAIILLYLAFRGIRRDELLVKAYERIR
jgi:predicted membrane protein